MSVPLLRLAPLDQIRGFVAVARRMSIKDASKDLCLSQSAVSRQVTTLEEALGFALFVRRHRAIALTPEGERLFRVADNALQQLQDVFASLGSAREGLPVTITASVGVTALWLLPRLVRFQQQHPTVDVRLAAKNKVLDLRTENVDLAIRYCSSDDAPAGARKLFSESIAPVGHPSLLSDRLLTAEGIRDQVLIEFDDESHPWLQWESYLRMRGMPRVQPKAILRLNHYDQVVQAARTSQGIALGRVPLVKTLLNDGSLVQLAEAADTSPDFGYWLIQADQGSRRAVDQLVEWIVREAAME